MDTIVFDIETQNFFTDPGVGWNNFGALKISAIGIYSYERNEYACFEEHETARAAEFFRAAARIVGFSINSYDVPVLHGYFAKLPDAPNLWEKERVDLLEEVESLAGKRISLSKLAEANLGEKKERHGSEAAELYRDGRMDVLKEYCLNDVRLTKALYDMYRDRKYFLFPDKQTGEMARLDFTERRMQTARLF